MENAERFLCPDQSTLDNPSLVQLREKQLLSFSHSGFIERYSKCQELEKALYAWTKKHCDTPQDPNNAAYFKEKAKEFITQSKKIQLTDTLNAEQALNYEYGAMTIPNSVWMLSITLQKMFATAQAEKEKSRLELHLLIKELKSLLNSGHYFESIGHKNECLVHFIASAFDNEPEAVFRDSFIPLTSDEDSNHWINLFTKMSSFPHENEEWVKTASSCKLLVLAKNLISANGNFFSLVHPNVFALTEAEFINYIQVLGHVHDRLSEPMWKSICLDIYRAIIKLLGIFLKIALQY